MKAASYLSILVAALAVSACGIIPNRENFNPSAEFSATDSGTIVVIGIDPAYQVGVQAMHVLSPTTFEQEFSGTMEFVIFPKDGYIVARVKPLEKDERYSVYQVATNEGAYFACNGAIGPTFDVRPGAVT